MSIPLNDTRIYSAFSSLPIDFAYIFGSYARGTAQSGSDIDVAVVRRQGATDPVDCLHVLLEDKLGISNLDLHELNLESDPLFIREVLCRGEVLYAVDEKQRVNFEMRLIQRLHDSENIRRVNDYYLRRTIEANEYGS